MKSDPFSLVIVFTGSSNSMNDVGFDTPNTDCSKSSQKRWVSPFSYPLQDQRSTNAPADTA